MRAHTHTPTTTKNMSNGWSELYFLNNEYFNLPSTSGKTLKCIFESQVNIKWSHAISSQPSEDCSISMKLLNNEWVREVIPGSSMIFLMLNWALKGFLVAIPFISKSKVGELSRGWPKGSFFNSYHTELKGRVLLHSLHCSILPLILTL